MPDCWARSASAVTRGGIHFAEQPEVGVRVPTTGGWSYTVGFGGGAPEKVPVEGMTQEQLAAVENEIMILKSLTHPHIVKYRSSYMASQGLGKVLVMLMEYAAGGDLAKVVRTAQREMRALSRRDRPDLRPADVISSAQIGTWLAQIASALQYVHEMRVLHRDLAPKNVLLTIDKQCKVSDFGLSFQMTQSNCGLAKSMVGTPYYMAPEVRPTSGCLPSNFPVPYTPFRSPQRRSCGRSQPRPCCNSDS